MTMRWVLEKKKFTEITSLVSNHSVYKFWKMQCKKHVKFEVEWRGAYSKNVRFSMEDWPYLGNGERYGQGYY